MAKRKRKRAQSDPVETRAYTDADGNVLTLRCSLSAATMRTLAREASGRAAASAEDAWQRRNEILFERLAVELGDRRPAAHRSEAAARPLPDGR